LQSDPVHLPSTLKRNHLSIVIKNPAGKATHPPGGSPLSKGIKRAEQWSSSNKGRRGTQRVYLIMTLLIGALNAVGLAAAAVGLMRSIAKLG
jgi:hypothetical protein